MNNTKARWAGFLCWKGDVHYSPQKEVQQLLKQKRDHEHCQVLTAAKTVQAQRFGPICSVFVGRSERVATEGS